MPLPWSVRGGLFEIHPNDSGQLFPASPPGRTAGRQQQQEEEEEKEIIGPENPTCEQLYQLQPVQQEEEAR